MEYGRELVLSADSASEFSFATPSWILYFAFNKMGKNCYICTYVFEKSVRKLYLRKSVLNRIFEITKIKVVFKFQFYEIFFSAN